MDSFEDTTSSSQPSILIIEDEEGPRESLRMILSSDYNLYSVDSAEIGLDILRKHPIDLITLDLKLPGQQGIDLLHEIRQEGHQVDVIIITGYGTLQTAIDAIQHGISAYILKPFNVSDLRDIIHKTLDRRRRFQSLHQSLKAFSSLWTGEGNPASLVKNIRTLLEATSLDLANHAKRVNDYSLLLADQLDLPSGTKKSLQLGAFLHDIGKIGIHSRVSLGIGKTPEQDEEILKCHPDIGERMIQALPLPPQVREIILYHHERYDGKGYPSGLSGEEIPYPARIVSIANFFDNLVTGQTEFGSITIPEARERIRCEAGLRLDPKLAEFFPKVI